ncbi:MAG TPA: hypothetical protein VMF07_13645 [Solirubrobacteraceae bacterium]|nr:hypothetical protein [Solirubrobacteraceae bacterium]
MPDFDESQIARLLAALPPAPDAWVHAAQQLPAARAALDTLVARAETSVEARESTLRDLEAALEAEGLAPEPAVVAELLARLNGRAG